MPLGILPVPFAYDAPSVVSEREAVFEGIYKSNTWGSAESGSGSGSEIRRTERYRTALLQFLREQKITSMFDAPCGDLNWMRLVLNDYPMQYLGGDIADSALATARQNRPGVQVRKFDICSDPFPDCEVWHCRDALFHLSFADARLALENAAQSNIRLALLTTHRSLWLRNLDIRTGGWRHVDLERPPFCLPRPLGYLPDTGTGEFPRFVGIWPISALRQMLRPR
jgi:SAM-dependent methyltransferase